VEFENEFTVQAPVDEVYSAMLDLERVTPAMPGAQVLEKIDDDHYKVAIKVKLGPVTMTYRGDVTIVEKDASAHRAVLDVKAKEARGQGSANAKVTMSLSEQGGSATAGTMRAEVLLSGKAAAMSRGVIDDVSKRLVTTFAGNLEEILGSEASTAAGEGDGAGGSVAGSAAAGSGEAEAGSNGGATPSGEAEATPKPPPPSPARPGSGPQTAAGAKPRPAPPPAAEALDMGPLAAGMAADRLKDPKVLGAVLGGTLLLGFLLGRRRS
jgi:carbon monoxide dehydrogenase subunit G